MAQKLREEETRNFQMETELSRVKVLDPITSTRCCPNFKLQRLAGGDAEHSPREIT